MDGSYKFHHSKVYPNPLTASHNILWDCIFVAVWIGGGKYQRKSTRPGSETCEHLTRDYGSYSIHCSSSNVMWRVAQWVGGRGVLGGSSVREWCFARDNSPTTAAIYHPPFFPSLPCTKCCLATTKTFWEITLPLVSGEPFWQTILTNGFGFYIERCVIWIN